MNTKEFRDALTRMESMGESSVSVELFKKIVEQLEQQPDPEEIYGLKTRIQELELVAIKLEAERNAAVEIHKQVLRDVISKGSNTPQEKDIRSPVR